jgi:hypothetical protein
MNNSKYFLVENKGIDGNLFSPIMTFQEVWKMRKCFLIHQNLYPEEAKNSEGVLLTWEIRQV